MKPTYVGVLVASLFILIKMVLFFAGLQYTIMVRTAWMPLLILVLVGVLYIINKHIRTCDNYDWIVAFKKGFTVALFSGVISGIFIYIYYSFIDTDHLQLLQVEMYNQIKVNMSKEEMEKSAKSLKSAFRPTTFSIVTISAVNVIGLIGSIIVALLGRMTMMKKV